MTLLERHTREAVDFLQPSSFISSFLFFSLSLSIIIFLRVYSLYLRVPSSTVFNVTRFHCRQQVVPTAAGVSTTSSSTHLTLAFLFRNFHRTTIRLALTSRPAKISVKSRLRRLHVQFRISTPVRGFNHLLYLLLLSHSSSFPHSPPLFAT